MVVNTSVHRHCRSLLIVNVYNVPGGAAPLEVLVDGMEFTGTEYCVGENVTFICSLPFVSHQWFGPKFNRILNCVSPTDMDGPDTHRHWCSHYQILQ